MIFVFIKITLISFSKKMLEFPVDILGNCHVTLSDILSLHEQLKISDIYPVISTWYEIVLSRC